MRPRCYRSTYRESRRSHGRSSVLGKLIHVAYTPRHTMLYAPHSRDSGCISFETSVPAQPITTRCFQVLLWSVTQSVAACAWCMCITPHLCHSAVHSTTRPQHASRPERRQLRARMVPHDHQPSTPLNPLCSCSRKKVGDETRHGVRVVDMRRMASAVNLPHARTRRQILRE